MATRRARSPLVVEAGSITLGEVLPLTPEQIREGGYGLPPLDTDAANDAGPGILRGTADSAIALGRGVAQGVRGLTDLAGTDNPVSEAIGEGISFLDRLESPERRAERERRAQIIKEAEASGSITQEISAYLGSFVEAPLDTLLEAVGSSAPTLLAAFLPGGQGAVAARIAATAGVGAAQGAGFTKRSIADSTEQGLLEDGVAPEEARARAIEAQSFTGPNSGQIGIGGVIGAAAGRFGAEGVVARGLAKVPLASGRAGQALSAATGEFATEAVQGGHEQLAGNLAQQREGLDVPLMQGVYGSSALEGVAGAGVGAGFGALVGSPRTVAEDEGAAGRAQSVGEMLAQAGAGQMGAQAGPTPGATLAATDPVEPRGRPAIRTSIDEFSERELANARSMADDSLRQTGEHHVVELRGGTLAILPASRSTSGAVSYYSTAGAGPTEPGRATLDDPDPAEAQARNDRLLAELTELAKDPLILKAEQATSEDGEISWRFGALGKTNRGKRAASLLRRAQDAGIPEDRIGAAIAAGNAATKPASPRFDDPNAPAEPDANALERARTRARALAEEQGGRWVVAAVGKPEEGRYEAIPPGRLKGRQVLFEVDGGQRRRAPTAAPAGRMEPGSNRGVAPIEERQSVPTLEQAERFLRAQRQAGQSTFGAKVVRRPDGGYVLAFPDEPEFNDPAWQVQANPTPAPAPATGLSPRSAGAEAASERPARGRRAQGQTSAAGPANSSTPAAGTPEPGSDAGNGFRHGPSQGMPTDGRVTQDSNLVAGATVVDADGRQYRVQSQEGGRVTAQPLADGQPQGEPARFWVDTRGVPESGTRTDPIYPADDAAPAVSPDTPADSPDLGQSSPDMEGSPPDTTPDAAPMFATWKDAQAWIAEGAKRAGGKRRFEASPEYRAAYPQIRALFDAQAAASAAEAMDRMRAAGLKIGDRVQTFVPGAFLGGATHTGTLIERGGRPVVRIDGELTVSKNGRLREVKSLDWDARWKKVEEDVQGGLSAAERADPDVRAFIRSAERVKRDEKESDPADWTDEERAAYDSGDWRTFSRLRGYSDDEIENFGEFMRLSRVLDDRYGEEYSASLSFGMDQGLVSLGAEEDSTDRSATTAAPPSSAARGSAITDFGEKIEGARKDVWESFRDKLRAAGDLDIAAEPLSQSWPAPDYQALLDGGADPWAVAFMHAARDAVPTKPKKAWKVRAWADSVRMLRDVAMGLADGRYDRARAQEMLAEAAKTSRAMADIAGRIELYQLVGHSKSLAGVRISRGEYSIVNGVEHNPPTVIWTVEKQAAATAFSNWPRELARAGTKEQALAAFKEKFDSIELSRPASKETTFEIYSRRGEAGYWIGKKIGRNPLFLEGPFSELKEARAYKDAHNAELTAKLERAKEIPSERRDTNEPRVGEDFRGGQDATPELFAETFGFRGVQFGNYVEQSRRQQDLNDAFDALMDMAALLGVPPRALSLNGELGLAFGARGRGGKGAAMAHYESGQVVINLTKRKGAGSLGHEWWHALDNYFSRRRGVGQGYTTEARDVGLAASGSNFEHRGEVRREMIDAFGEVVRAIRSTAIRARSSRLDARRTKAYWTTTPEMSARAFESYLISKLQDANASNDYLANIVDEQTWKAAQGLGFELDDSYPYPTAGEIPAIRAAFDHFFETIQTRETDRGVALFSRDTASAAPAGRSDQVRAVVDQVAGDWAIANKIRVIDTFDAAPTRVREENDAQLAGGASGVPWAFFHDGEIWLVADQLHSPAEIASKLYHEATHFGLRGAFGSTLDPILDEIARRRPGEVRAIAKRYGLDFNNERQRRIAAEESLAAMAEANPKPTMGFVARAIAAIRDILDAVAKRLGFELELTDAQLVRNLILPAREYARNGGKPAGPRIFGRTFSPLRARPGTEFSRGPDIQPLPRAAATFDEARAAAEEFKGRELTNRSTGLAAKVSRNSLDKMLSRSAVGKSETAAMHAATVANLDVLFEGGVLGWSKPDDAGDPNVAAIHRYFAAAEIDGRPVLAKITVKETGDAATPNRIYTVESVATNEESPAVMWVAAAAEADGLDLISTRPSGDVHTLAQEVDRRNAGGDTRFSRSPAHQLMQPGGPSPAAEDALGRGFTGMLMQNWEDSTRNTRTFKWWRGINTQYHKATLDADFKRVFDAAQDFQKDVSRYANRAADLAPTLLPNIASARDILAKSRVKDVDMERLAEAVLQGTLVDSNPANGKVWSDAELRSRFKMNDKQVGLYHEYRAALVRALDDFGRSELISFADEHLDPLTRRQIMEAGSVPAAHIILKRRLAEVNRDSTPEERKDLQKLRQRIDARVDRIEALKAGGYAPLMRFGRNAVWIRTQKSPGEFETHWFSLHDNLRDANKTAREMLASIRQDHPNAVLSQGITSDQEHKLFAGVTPDTLEVFGEEAGFSDSAEWKKLIELTRSNRSALKRMLERKRTPGFSRDMTRVLAAFVTSQGRATAGNVHQGELVRAVRAIPDGKGDVKDDAVRLHQYLQNPGEEAQAIRGLLFTWFLGGSVASAAVNITQPLTMSLPYIAIKDGAVKGAARILSAAKDVIAGKYKPDTAKALKRAELEGGVVDPQEVHMLQAEVSRNLGASVRLRKAMFAWGYLFAAAERFNRRVTFVAAYEQAKELGSLDPVGDAERAVVDTQGIYNRANRMNWARGAIPATVFTFKQFSIAYVEFVARLLKNKDTRPAGLLALGILIMLSGLSGLPFMEDLDDIVDTAAQAAGYNFQSDQAKQEFLAGLFGEQAADFALYGLSSIPGSPVDVQARLGLGNLLPGTAAFKKSGGPNAGMREMLDVFGAAGGLGKQAADATRALFEGEPTRAATSFLPVAAANFAKGLDMLQTGMYRDRRGKQVIPVTTSDALAKSVGFQPASVGRANRLERDILGSNAIVRGTEAEIAGLWATGIFEKDKAKQDRARARLRAWNRNNPETPIRITPQQLRQRVGQMALTRGERIIKSSPREVRAAAARALRQQQE